MCSLQKLSVQGIRSFSPDNPQVITFFPLTLILGPNGSGKTTLIECLRYATSGETPPNSSKGKLWIHDPSLGKSHTVRAQVKLEFMDSSNVVTIVSRPLELTLTRDKGDKVTSRMRTLNAAIKRTNISGDSKTVANAKCIDVEIEILNLLGVSKAVLTNVIFCHQEDSTWPLSDGKILKEKFDAIFGSLGYVKALQKVKALRKDRLDQQKLKQQELMLFAEHKERCEKSENEYQNQKLVLAKHQMTVEKLNKQLSPLQEQFNEIEQKERTFATFEKSVANMKGKLEEKRKQFDDIKKSIIEVLKCSREELVKDIENFQKNLRVRKIEIDKVTAEISRNDSDIKTAVKNRDCFLLEKGKYDMLKKEYQRNIERQSELIEKIIQDKKFSGLFHANADTNEFINQLRTVIANVSKEKNKVIGSMNCDIEQLQEALDGAKLKQVTMKHSCAIAEESIRNKHNEKQTLEEKLRALSSSSSKLNCLRSEITEKESALEALEKPTVFDETLKTLNFKKSKAKEENENLKSIMYKMQADSQQRTEMNILTRNIQKEKENVKEIFAMNSSIVKSFNINEYDTDKSLHQEFTTRFQNMNANLALLKDELGNLETEKSNDETLYKVEIDKLNDLNQELKDKTKAIKNVCGTQSYEEFFEKINKEVENLRGKCTAIKSSTFIWEEVVSDIIKGKMCIVCDRSFDDDKHMQNTVSKLRKEMENTPSSQTALENDLKIKSDLCNSLHSLQAVNERIKELPGLIEKSSSLVNKLKEKIDSLCSSIVMKKKKYEEDSSAIDKLKFFEKSALEWDRSIKEIKEIDTKIQKLSQRLYHDETNGFESIDDVRDEIEKKDEEISGYEKESERIHRKKGDHFKQHCNLQQDVNDLKSELLNIENQQQSRVSFERKLSEVNDDIRKFNEELTELKQRLISCNESVDKLDGDMLALKKNKEIEEDKFRKQSDCLNSLYKDLESLNCAIDSFVKEGKETSIQLETQQQQIEQRLTTLHETRSILLDRQQFIDKEISNSEQRQRNLRDNLKLLDYSNDIESLQTEIKEEESKLGVSDISSLLRRKKQLNDDINAKRSEKDRADSLKTPVISRMSELEKELKLDKYKNAKENFRNKQLEVIAESIVCEDLDKYYKALDHSVMTYHQKKMEDINRLAFKLWKQTYRGGDIEYIKIVFDENEERLASDRKRNYNYRVVMVKEGGVEMDMRGRCSAGQKVLACLVIRLALAEIFCINCGMLALDEPTTNLDKENVESFAIALTEIVKSHKQLNNFQIILITHDEYFLKCLDEESDEYYYRVFKQTNGYSKVKRCSLKERN